VTAVAEAALPSPQTWRAAAARHGELFDALDPGARVALVARPAAQSMLLWEAAAGGVDARLAPFGGYAASGADIVLAADDEALGAIAAAVDGALFEALRDGIRSGHVVCFVLRRRCQLEERGFDELLDALGYAFMGACR
jgi:hypothetical protein